MNSIRSAFQSFVRRFRGTMSGTTPVKDETKIIWVDLEMTGLDINKERIIEMAVAITDAQLNNLIIGPDIVIHQNDSLLSAMDEWNTSHHGASGLTDSVRNSKVSEQEAEDIMLAFVQKHTEPGKCPLAGNSIYMDKMFLMKYMPRFCDHLHHRLVDVSTLKELNKRWRPDVSASTPSKVNTHRAMDDIKESIEELRHYKTCLFD